MTVFGFILVCYNKRNGEDLQISTQEKNGMVNSVDFTGFLAHCSGTVVEDK